MYFSLKKAQAATEFLMVVGIAFTMLVPALFLFSQYSESSNQQIISSQIDRIGRELISSAEAMYYYGKNSRTTIVVNFPDKINSIYFNNKTHSCSQNPPPGKSCVTELVFNATLFGGKTMLVFFSKINITGNLTSDLSMVEAFSEGPKSFLIESYGDYVNISRKRN